MKQFLKYKTKDGETNYQFSFEEQSNGEWRAYIEWQPSYRGRSTDNHSTHRFPDAARMYVCWENSLDSLSEAKQVAALWSDCTQEYIRTGKRFK